MLFFIIYIVIFIITSNYFHISRSRVFSSSDANAAVINSMHRRLRHPRCSLRRVVSSASSIDSSVVVVESSGSSLSDDASIDLGVMTTNIRPHSPTPPRKTVQVVVLVIENKN